MTRKLFITSAITAFAFLLATQPAEAQQRHNIRNNASLNLEAAATDVTRITITGDRIRRIVKDESFFDEMNDDITGDVFLRYSGDLDDLQTESGYILTERGATIGYQLTPRQGRGPQTIIIAISGTPEPEHAPTSADADDSGGFEMAAGEGGGGYAASLVALTKSAIDTHVIGRDAPRRPHGTAIATERAGAQRVRVRVANGGRTGRHVRPQDFYTPTTLAVWLERQNLGANETAWVVVVENSR